MGFSRKILSLAFLAMPGVNAEGQHGPPGLVDDRDGGLRGNDFARRLEAPANDLCANAIAVDVTPDGVTVAGATTFATFDNLGSCGTSNTAPGIWYTFTAQANTASFLVSTCNEADFDTKITVYKGGCDGLECVAGVDDTFGCDVTTKLPFEAEADTQYWVLVHGFDSDVGNFALTISSAPPPANDLCANAIAVDVTPDGVTVAGATTFATFDNLGVCGFIWNEAPGIWYTFTAHANTESFLVSTCNEADFVTAITVFKGGCDDLECVAAEDYSPGCAGFTTLLPFDAEADTQYWVLVHGYESSVGSFALTMTSSLYCGSQELTVQNLSASTTENPFVPNNAIDGKQNSRWASLGPDESRRQLTPAAGVRDEQWLKLDMNKIVFIDSIILEWERAYSRDYTIEVSVDGEDGPWTVVSNGNDGEKGKVELGMLNTLGRFVRIFSYEGDRNYGISLFEVKIFGDADKSCTPPPILPTGDCRGAPTIIDIVSAKASSQENNNLKAEKAIDGNFHTRWSSEWTDDEWFVVDLGAPMLLSAVKLHWENAYATNYELQVPVVAIGGLEDQSIIDAATWTTIVAITDSDGDVDVLDGLTATTQYVRLLCTQRARGYGNSLYEFEVHGTPVCANPIVYGLQPDCHQNDGSKYNICLDLKGESGAVEDWMSTFADARERWETTIVDNDGPAIRSPASWMSASDIATEVPSHIDDLYIAGVHGYIDGPRNILGWAGPTYGRYVSRNNGQDYYWHVVAGEMRFDKDDTASLISAGTWSTVILHEIGHVLGIGTLWRSHGLHAVDATGLSDDYLGAIAQQKWADLGCSGDLPVETDGGPGTAGGHWDELCLVDELMTGYIGLNPGYISEITIGALEDLGYTGVDYSLADPYDLSNLSHSGCATYCPEATGPNRRLDSSRSALSADDVSQMERYAAIKLHEARDVQEVMPDGIINLSGELITVYFIDEENNIHGMMFSWDDVKDVV